MDYFFATENSPKQIVFGWHSPKLQCPTVLESSWGNDSVFVTCLWRFTPSVWMNGARGLRASDSEGEKVFRDTLNFWFWHWEVMRTLEKYRNNIISVINSIFWGQYFKHMDLRHKLLLNVFVYVPFMNLVWEREWDRLLIQETRPSLCYCHSR